MNNSKIIKSFILAFLLILSSALFWKGLADIYLKGNFSASSLIWFIVWLLLFMIFFLFFSLLVESKGMFLVVCSLALISFFIFFPFNQWLVLGLIIFFVAFILSRVLIQKERKERLKISLRKVFGRGLPWTLTILALFIGLTSYFYPPIPIEEDEVVLPPQISNWFIKPLAGTLGKVLPIIDEKTTVDEALTLTLAKERADLVSFSPELLDQLKDKNIKDLDLKDLVKDPKIVEKFKEEAVEQVKKIDPQILIQQRNDLAQTLGINLTGKETISDLVNKTVNAKIKEAISPVAGALPIVSAILTFVALRLIFVPLGWIIVFLALIIFKFLCLFKFVTIKKVMKEGEDVSM